MELLRESWAVYDVVIVVVIFVVIVVVLGAGIDGEAWLDTAYEFQEKFEKQIKIYNTSTYHLGTVR